MPNSFEDFGSAINEVYSKLVESGVIKVRDEPPVPSIPVDYDWARKLGLFLSLFVCLLVRACSCLLCLLFWINFMLVRISLRDR